MQKTYNSIIDFIFNNLTLLSNYFALKNKFVCGINTSGNEG